MREIEKDENYDTRRRRYCHTPLIIILNYKIVIVSIFSRVIIKIVRAMDKIDFFLLSIFMKLFERNFKLRIFLRFILPKSSRTKKLQQANKFLSSL